MISFAMFGWRVISRILHAQRLASRLPIHQVDRRGLQSFAPRGRQFSRARLGGYCRQRCCLVIFTTRSLSVGGHVEQPLVQLVIRG